MLGASDRHVTMIQKARLMGFNVVCFDKDPNAPGATHCDSFYPISITNVADVVARAISLKVDVCISVPDIGLKACAAVNSTLNLKGIHMGTFLIATNKETARDVYIDAGLNVPPHSHGYPSDEAPWVVKPIKSTGSNGVRILRSCEELKEYSMVNNNHIREDYIAGDIVTVDALMVDGDLKYYLMQDRLLMHGDSLVDSIIISPSRYYGTETERVLLETAVKTARAIGLKDGNINVQMIVDQNCNVYLIEVNPRFSGPYGVECHSLATHTEWLCDTLNVLRGTPEKITTPVRLKVIPNACVTIASMESGVLNDVILPEEVHVKYSWWWKKKGDQVYKINAVKDCIGFVFLMGPTYEYVLDNAHNIIANTQIKLGG